MRIEDKYLVFDKGELLKCTKISGHTFVQLADLDKYCSWGDCLIYMHGILPKERVDSKYLKRGNFAEEIVQRVYKRDGYEIQTYDPKKIKYDNFPEHETFGGVIDIELPKEHEIIEVKSKSMKDYDLINESGMPEAETMQAALYAYLRDYSYYIMEYIFFDTATEQAIFEGQKPTTLKYIKRIKKEFMLDKAKLEKLLELAKNRVNEFRTTCRIPLDAISDNVLNKLGLERPDNDTAFWSELPF